MFYMYISKDVFQLNKYSLKSHVLEINKVNGKRSLSLTSKLSDWSLSCFPENSAHSKIKLLINLPFDYLHNKQSLAS